MRSLVMALLNSIAASPLMHFRLRTLIYRAAGFDVALRSRIHPGCTFAGNQLTVGWRASINRGCHFDNGQARVSIGNRVGIGQGVRFITSDHDTSNPLCRAGATRYTPITVKDGAFIGAGSTILGGVTIGDGAVVAAGSVVTNDCPPHTVSAGVPARVVRALSAEGGVSHADRVNQ